MWSSWIDHTNRTDELKDRLHPLSSIVFSVLISIILLLINSSVYADSWSFFWENDLLVGSDDQYTNGIGLTWMSEALCHSDLSKFEQVYGEIMRDMVNSPQWADLQSCRQIAGIKVSQGVITPTDTTEEELIEDDLPYSGYLTHTFLMFEWDQESISRYHFNIGLVGPSSGAEFSQKYLHRIIGNGEPKGWDNQLSDQLTAGIGYSYSQFLWQGELNDGNGLDLRMIAGAEVGNFYTGALLGSMARYGYNYPRNVGPIDGFTLEGINSDTDSSYGWSVNLGATLNAVGYLYVVDAAEDHDLERKILFLSPVFSICLYFSNTQFVFSLESTIGVFNDKVQRSGWGGIEIVKRY